MSLLKNSDVLSRIYAAKKPEDISTLVADAASDAKSDEAQRQMRSTGINPDDVNVSASAIRMAFITLVAHDNLMPEVERFAAISALLPVNGDVNEGLQDDQDTRQLYS